MAYSIDYLYRIIDKYTRPLGGMARIQSRFNKDLERGQEDLKKFGDGLKRFATTAAIGGIAALGGSLAYAVKQASKIEDVTAAFTPLMGGADKAKELVDRLNKEAATTPFQFENIASSAKQLLPLMNQDIERTAETFRMLGDTAGGNAQTLDTVTRAYSKVLGKGRADMEALNMITEAGVPIMDQLSKKYGVTINELYEMSSAGKITEQMITDTFKTMTSKGGIFFEGMEISSKTFTGLMSTLRDYVANTAASIGSTMLPILKDYVKVAIKAAGNVRQWVENNKELIAMKVKTFFNVLKKIGKVVVTVGKGLFFMFKVLKPFLPIIIGVIAAWKAYRVAMMIAAAANLIFKATDPLSLTITAIGVLIGLVYLLIKNWDKVVAVMARVGKKVLEVWDTVKGFLMFVLPGFVQLVEVIRTIIENWGYVKKSFTDKGFLAGIFAIGKAIVAAFISPIESLLNAAGKIPKVGEWAKKAAGGLKKFREGLFPKETETKLEEAGKKTEKIIKKTRDEAKKPLDLTKITDATQKSMAMYKEAQYKAKERFAFQEMYVSKPTERPQMTKNDATVNANMNLRVYNETESKIAPMSSSGDLGYNEVGR